MGEEIIEERLPRVRADFSGGAITPLSFAWAGREWRVRRVNARWVDRRFTPARRGFAVTACSGEVFQLSYREGECLWFVERIVV